MSATILLAALTERHTLGCSSAGKGLGEPREHHGLPPAVAGECIVPAVRARQSKVGRRIANLEPPGIRDGWRWSRRGVCRGRTASARDKRKAGDDDECSSVGSSVDPHRRQRYHGVFFARILLSPDLRETVVQPCDWSATLQ